MGVSHPVVHINMLGNMGNRMMQFMTAHAIASRVPGCQISNLRIPEFDLFYREIPHQGEYKISIEPHQEKFSAGLVNIPDISSLLRIGELKRLELSGYCQNVGNFSDQKLYQSIFLSPISDAVGFGVDDLVINIRMGDIVNGHHKDYIVLPVDFYLEVVKATGLRPVFLGQLEDNAYLRDLRAAFPEAQFISSRGAKHDFECIRRSKNILLAISTFSWMAAWLSNAERIFMPVAGMFHPRQHPWSNLLPLGDRRYSYYLFPIHHAVPVDEVKERHSLLRGLWRQLTEQHLKDLASGPRYPRQKSDYLRVYDEEYYQRAHRDVRESVQFNGLPSGLTHYVATGYDEERNAIEIDEEWYFRTYLMAAIEVGQGDYLDAAHHYAAIGAARGYHPMPMDGRQEYERVQTNHAAQ
jgi:hypothetical protein